MVDNTKVEQAISLLLEGIGEDTSREGLLETPKRVTKAWGQWASGYGRDPKEVMKKFTNPGVDQLVIVSNLDFYSMCEHHMAPFYGQVHIAYVPGKYVLGVSKFSRLTDIFSRRLQIQERLTQEIAQTIMEELQPLGVGVVIEGVHLCMRSRGVEKQNAKMVTSVMLGDLREKTGLRQEFLASIKLAKE